MRNTYLYTNNAESTVAGSINSAASSVILQTGTGVKFPNPSSNAALNEMFKLTHINAAGQVDEVVNVTRRVGDTLTIVRGQEGTTPVAWTAGDKVAHLFTADNASNFAQNVGAVGFFIDTPVKTLYIPVNVFTVNITACAGGGAGGRQTTATGTNIVGGSGGGGAGESTYFAAISVTAGDRLDFVIGAGGISNGANGGNTVISKNSVPVITLRGGSNGLPGNTAAATVGNLTNGGDGGAGYPMGGDGGGTEYFSNAGFGGAGASGTYGGGGGMVRGLLSSIKNGNSGSGFGAGASGSGGKADETNITSAPLPVNGQPGMAILHAG